MGAEFLFSVITTLSGLLSSLKTLGLITTDEEGDGIGIDLGRLERLLKRIQATLCDASEREIRDTSVKLWLKELQAVAFKAEDILDECRYELLSLKIEESKDATSSSPAGMNEKCLKGAISDGMAERIKSVINHFKEISKDREALGLKEDEGERRAYAWPGLLPTSHMMVNESAVFGRDKDKKKISDYLLFGNRGPTNQILVITIVGMGGVGKTTLAQLVYNDPSIRCYFDMTGWVYVSPQFDVIRITREVLETISEKAYNGFTGLSAVQHAFLKEIKGKKLLLVLDDVWNELPDKWEQFLAPLHAAESVRILVTTRDKAVAQMVQATYTYDLKCLPTEQCNLLFEHYAFGDKIVDNFSKLREISAQIIKKCAGLPLAIKCMGRALSCNMREDSWRDILESELWESDGKDEIFPALKVSYYSLPQELKPCLLFCSLFPKGYHFHKDEIIYMWIAHGYIQLRGNKSEECVGEEFIRELDRRSFLMMYKQRWEETFTMHDLIHDLARSISMDQFYIDISEVHHINTENCSMISTSNDLMRTLIDNAYNQKSDLDCNLHMDMKRHYNFNLYTNTKLRVLKWNDAYSDDLEHIGNLKHLRYIELNRSKVERLPESITLLFNLVALKISFFGYLKELPAQIGNLVNLRFVNINIFGIRALPESLGQLSNVQTLYLGCPIKKLPVFISKLINLKKLHISYLECAELPESCCMLRKLQTLILEKCWNIKRLPESIGNLDNLQCMYILSGCIEILPESIKQLCNLEILEFRTSGTLDWLLKILDGLLNKSSLNISIEMQIIDTMEIGWKGVCSGDNSSFKYGDLKLDGKFKTSKKTWKKFRKSKSFLECLQPLNHLIKLRVDGNQGIGYPSWLDDIYHSRVAIFMHCYLNNNKFFVEFRELPSLKSLTLIGGTLGDDFSQTIASHDFRVIFPSLEELEFIDMLDWNPQIGQQDRGLPILQSLKISNCPSLSSVPKFCLMRKLEIIKCSFSSLELDKFNLQLESLHIEECLQLTLLLGLPSLTSLQTLYVVLCPQLNEFSYPNRLIPFLSIEIVECPSLKNWCRRHKLKYIEKLSSKSLATSGIQNIIKEGSQRLLLENLLIENSLEGCLKFHLGLNNLVRLEIKNCRKLKSLKGLSELKGLRRLVLWDCPLLQQEEYTSPVLSVDSFFVQQGEADNGDTKPIPLGLKSLIVNHVPFLLHKKVDNGDSTHLPPNLRSLIVHGCHRMLHLDLQLECPSLFTELEVIDCKMLTKIRGLEELTILETLAIIQCPRLILLGPLPNEPDCVVISGCPGLKTWCQINSVEPLDEEEMGLAT